MSKEKPSTHNRREILQFLGASGLLAILATVRCRFIQKNQSLENNAGSEWPIDQEGIVNKIEQLAFNPGSELRTNFFPRKTMWESVQLLKMRGEWVADNDESDWMAHPEIIESALDMLVDAGIKGARLVVVPFEVTTDGEQYNWQPVETALDMFQKRNMVASLSVGPLDFPFGPAGIRLPEKFANMLKQEMTESGEGHIDLSISPDSDLPISSKAISDFSLSYLQRITEKYTDDPRIDKFYLGNEWPDNHAIEGVEGTMQVGREFMEVAVATMMAATKKKIVLNTNIHPSELERLQAESGPLLLQLGAQGVLGLDPYPTQEEKDSMLAKEIERYGEHVERIREAFPETEIVFTEYQAEPWPPDGLAGKSWAEIQQDHPKVVEEFFQKSFPRTLETYMINSGIKEVGLYGSPQWTIAAQMGYDFPLELLKTISSTMSRA